MKKSLLIAGGVMIILILIALWVYLLFFGTPKNIEDVFTSFNFSDNKEVLPPANTEATPVQENPLVNVNGKALRQLTTRPVIGFREVAKNASSSPQVYYAEAGTGHVYSINLTTGEERRISGTTITDATRADFTDDGAYVVIQSGVGRAQKTTLGEFKAGTESIDLFTLSDAVDDFIITHSGELLYTVKNAVLSGKAMNLSNQTVRTIFTLPFRDATIAWGSSAADTHYAYPKASYLLQGFVYSIKGNVITRLPLEGYGLVADGGSGLIALSYNEEGKRSTYFYNTSGKQKLPATFPLFPEKCVFSTKKSGTLWCASFNGSTGQEFPDNWYNGDITSRDVLFEITLSTDSLATTNLVDTFADTNREIDATGVNIGASEDNLYFINKNDNALWMYDLSL